MIFWFKKIIARCFFPVPVVLELALVGALLLHWERTRRAGRGLLAASLLLLYVMSLPVVGTFLVASLESRYAPLEVASLLQMSDIGAQTSASASESETAPLPAPGGYGPEGREAGEGTHSTSHSSQFTTIAVAGSGVSREGEFSDNFLVRLQEAGRIAHFLAEANCSFQLVVSIAMTEVSPEDKKSALVEYFESFGVKESQIFLVNEARNSQLEITAFLRVPGTVVLVSQAFHMPRLMRLVRCHVAEQDDGARQIVAAPAGCRGMQGPLTVLDFIPSADALAKTETVIYEWLGMVTTGIEKYKRL